MSSIFNILDDITFKEYNVNKIICNTCSSDITNLTDNLNYCFNCDKFFYSNSTNNKYVTYNLTVSQFENKVIHLTTIVNTIFKEKNVIDKVNVIEQELRNRNISKESVDIDDIYKIIKLKELKVYNSATEIYACIKKSDKTFNTLYIPNDIINVIESFFIKLFKFVYDLKKTNYTINYSFFLERILGFIGVDIGFRPKMLKHNKKTIENTHIWDGFLRHLNMKVYENLRR